MTRRLPFHTNGHSPPVYEVRFASLHKLTDTQLDALLGNFQAWRARCAGQRWLEWFFDALVALLGQEADRRWFDLNRAEFRGKSDSHVRRLLLARARERRAA